MPKTQTKIVDTSTGLEVIRDMTSEELNQIEADQLAIQAQAEATIAAANSKAALLTKLGISEEEAKLLLS